MKNSSFYFGALFVALALPSSGAVAQKSIVDEITGIEFIHVGKGCFSMGADKPGRAGWLQRPDPPTVAEVPRHEVCLDAFALGKTEVTLAQWNKLMGLEQAESDMAQRPAVNISWQDIQGLLQKLNSGQSSIRYRLPTEAEWEYACRAGTADRPYKDDDDEGTARLARNAWFAGSIKDDVRLQPVAGKEPNAWGFHDMIGNAWEWVHDSYGHNAYAKHKLYNPVAMPSGDKKVIRGGSIRSGRKVARCGARGWNVDAEHFELLGFRLVREEARPESIKGKVKK